MKAIDNVECAEEAKKAQKLLLENNANSFAVLLSLAMRIRNRCYGDGFIEDETKRKNLCG